jgi:hypothetical protein
VFGSPDLGRASVPLTAALLLFAVGGAAQTAPDELVGDCQSTSASLAACQDGALAYQAVQANLGLLLTGGTDLPGGASTLGWRVPGRPRLAVFSRLKASHVGMPDILGAAPGDGAEENHWLGGWEFGAAAGLFRGFSASPTVGGILSLDLLASAQWDLLPENPGFSGNAWSWSAGARLGVVRESFTLPGITVSARYAGVGDVVYGGDPNNPTSAVTMDLTARSIRAVVGKDLLAVGILGGFGWDRYESDGSFTVPGSGTVPGETIPVSGFATDRTMVFGQATLTYLVLQLSLELGWARGVDPLSTPYQGDYDPEAGSGFGALSARLTF